MADAADGLARVSKAVQGVAGLSPPADGERREAVPAATVVLLRDAATGLETLMVRRNAALAFAGGMWVWPGGRVDPVDRRDGADEMTAARRAAAREVFEEAGLALDPDALVPYSHWTPPAASPKRFATWFFCALAPFGDIVVDGGEIEAHRWIGPAEALRLHAAREIELAPPTWITLATLSVHGDAAGVMYEALRREPEVYETRIAVVPEGAIALYEGDAGYVDGDADRPGGRHRLTMTGAEWCYQRPDGTVFTAG